MYEVVYDVKLHEDYVGGKTKRFPVYEFDYDTMKHDLPGAFPTSASCTNTIIDVGTGDSALRYQKFRVESNQIKTYISSNIPIQTLQYGIPENISGAICPVNTNQPRSHDAPDHTFDFAGYGMKKQTSSPTDLNTNPHYVHGAIDDQYGTYSASFRPVFPYTIIDSWTPDTNQIENYHDVNHVMCKVLYTGTGMCHFSVWKYLAIPWGNYNDYRPQMLGVGFPPNKQTNWTDMDSRMKTYYGICNKNNVCLYDLDIPGKNDGTAAFYVGGSTNTESDWTNRNIYQFFVHYTVNGEDMFGIAVCYYNKDWGNSIYPTEMYIIGFGSAFWGDSIVEHTEDAEWGDNTETGGGEGIWTFPSASRGDGSGAIGTSIADEARQAMDAFFTGANGFKLHQLLPADIPDIYGTLYSTSFIQRYQNVMYSPLSAVLSVHMIPHKLLDLAHATTSSDLTLSGYNISTQVTQKTYPQIPTAYSYHVGKIDLDATDTFLDYAPYTNAYLHLPYIGVLTLDINAIASGSIAIDYITDAITGNCTALVWCSDRDGHAQPKYVAQGNCAYSMPMFSAQQDGSALGRIASSALGLTMSVATGNIAGAAAGIGSVAAGMFDAATAKQNTQVTGSFGGNAGMISDTMVWIEIVRPQWCNPEYYQLIQGIPSQMSGTISSYNESGSNYTGYLQIIDIDTDGIQATDAEIRQIEQLLRAGIFVDNDT